MLSSATALLLLAASAAASPLAKVQRVSFPRAPTTIKFGKRQDAPTAALYSSCTVDNMVAITLDDGPYIYNADIAKLLNDNGIKATFFVNGNNWDCIYDQAQAMQDAYAMGHMFASHTWDHPDLTTMSYDEIDSEMTQAEQALQKILGVQPAFFRPPYGSYNDVVLQVAAAHGQTVIIWDFDDGDSMGATVAESEADYDQLVASHPNNVMALNHETYDTTAYQVLPYAIQELINAGYTFGTVAECLGGMQPYQWTSSPGSNDGSWYC